MRYFSSFTGAGGFDLAIPQDWKCVGFSEIDKYANMVLKYRFSDIKNYGDVNAIKWKEIPDFDILLGGFPCQPFSIAGKRKGFEDIRGTLFFAITKTISIKHPRFLLLENVKGILSQDNGNTIERICEVLNNLGYIINMELYNAKDFGVPQNRERVFLACLNIKELAKEMENIGEKKKMIKYEHFIKSYLFQLLLNNLEEVKKLQEVVSKDYILSLLLWKEIINGLMPKYNSSRQMITLKKILKSYRSTYQLGLMEQSIIKYKNSDCTVGVTKDGITMDMGGKSYLLEKEEDMYTNIDYLLKEIWEENYLNQKSFTISTAINEITGWKTFSFAQVNLIMLTFMLHLRESSKNLWNDILSSLIVIQEGTKYERINKVTRKKVVTESGTSYKSEIFRKIRRERIFVIGFRDRRPTEVFFEPKCCPTNNELQGQPNTNTLRARYSQNLSEGSYIIEGEQQAQEAKLIELTKNMPMAKRIYASSGQAISLRAGGGGLGGKTGLYAVQAVLTPSREKKRQNGRRFKNPEEPMFTLTGQDIHGVAESFGTEMKIRRLTPKECERLMSWPDDWTRWGIDEKGNKVEISDTQRYKMAGNGVVSNVVRWLIENIISGD